MNYFITGGEKTLVANYKGSMITPNSIKKIKAIRGNKFPSRW
jgi:hypothetical protein